MQKQPCAGATLESNSLIYINECWQNHSHESILDAQTLVIASAYNEQKIFPE
jgi:hypothetical protein